MLVLGEGDGIAPRGRIRLDRGDRGTGRASATQPPVNISCTGSSVSASSSGERFGDERAVRLEEPSVARVLPVDRLEDHLALTRPIEDERRLGAMRGGRASTARATSRGRSRRIKVCTVARLDDGAVAEDQREGRRQLLEDRKREVIPPAGGNRNFDAARRSPRQSPPDSPREHGWCCRAASRRGRVRGGRIIAE